MKSTDELIANYRVYKIASLKADLKRISWRAIDDNAVMVTMPQECYSEPIKIQISRCGNEITLLFDGYVGMDIYVGENFSCRDGRYRCVTNEKNFASDFYCMIEAIVCDCDRGRNDY